MLPDHLVRAVIGEAISVVLLIDSGSDANVITEDVWLGVQEMFSDDEIFLYDVNLAPKRRISAFASQQPLTIKASFRAWIEVKTSSEPRKQFIEFVVIRGAGQCILGREAAKAMGLMKLGIGINNIEAETSEASGSDAIFPLIPNEVVDFSVDPNVAPTRNAFYNVPAAFRKRARERLDKMEKQQIIERVTKAPKWISGMFAVPKGPDDFRLVLNMRGPNKAILKTYHRLPHLEEMQRALHGATWFSKFDMPSAFHHVLLGEKSRELTTFLTDHGMFRFRRLLFGVNSAPEAFQQIMERVLEGLEGIILYIDDVLVFADSLEALIEREEAVLKRLQENNITPNFEKCEFRKQSLTFLGHTISAEGMNIAETKVKAIKAMRAPKTVTELRSFLGLANFVGSYIINFAELTNPLWELTKKDCFQWSDEAQNAFERVKAEIVECTLTKGFYSDTDETILYTDASPVSVGAVLTQVNEEGAQRIICCTSKTLTPTQRRYPQVHREALGIVQGAEDNRFFLYGRKFKILTDARPVSYIFKHEADWSKRTLSRAQSFALRLGEFDYNIEYIEGEKNIADSPSRLCVNNKDQTTVDRCPLEIAAISGEPEELVNGNQTLTLESLKAATAVDPVLLKVIELLGSEELETDTSLWGDEEVARFKPFFGELHVRNGIIIRTGRVIVPGQMREEALRVAHTGHPGETAMKSILRARVWWPGMDADIKRHVNECKGCALTARASPPVPMSRSIMPAAVWDYIAMDFNGPYAQHGGVYVVAICDYFSRYMIATIVQSIAFDVVKKVLDSVFERFGRPIGIRVDNGPPFNGQPFQDYCSSVNVEVIFTTPYHPQQNGMIERGMQTINKAMKIAKIEKVDLKEALRDKIRSYNSAVHRVTGVAPEELLHGRKIRRSLPLLDGAEVEFEVEKVREKDFFEKNQSKEREDRKRQAKKTALKVGDAVVIKKVQAPKKGDVWFKEGPWKIIEDLGHGDFKLRDEAGVEARRNVVHLKKVTWNVSRALQAVEPSAPNTIEPEESATELPEEQAPSVQIRASGRVRAAPEHLKDYVRQLM